MWFKSGTFSGLGTDAWISNYAIGIGSTQVPNGVRLAAGAMQVTDSTLRVPQLNVSGVSTLGVTTFTGNVSFGTSAFFGTDDRLILGDSSNLQLYYNSVNSIVSASAGLIVSGSSITYSSDAHSIQNAANTRTFANFAPSGTTFYYNNNTRLQVTTSGITVTGTTSTDQLSVSGVTTSTGGFVGNLTGTATTATVAQGLTGTPNITVGIVTATSFVKSGGTSSQFLKADGSVDTNTYLTSYTETDTLNSVTGRGNSTTNGIYVGILTATSGNFSGIITSSGANISGVVTATSFSGSGSNLTGIVTSIVAGSNITISGSTGQVTINAAGGSSSQWVTTSAGIHTLSKVGIGTTNPTENLSVLGKIQINQNSTSDNRLIFRGQPGSSYRWNIDNYGSSNEFRIFREDDATSANGFAPFSISTTGTLTATKFSGDGSLLTNVPQTKSITLDNPGTAEKVPMFFTPSQIVINRIQSVIGISTVGTGITFSIRYGADLSAAGTEVVTGGVSVASTTTGTSITSFNNATVPANNFVWITTSAISGSPTFLHATLVF